MEIRSFPHLSKNGQHMEKIRNIELQFACRQDPESFVPAEGGQFCSHCNKTVYDFSDKSLEDLLHFFETRGTSFCGAFTREQLKPARWWSRWSAAALVFVSSLISSSVSGQEPAPHSKVADKQDPGIEDIKSFGGVTEVPPRFPGGEKGFADFIRGNLVVPPRTPEGRVLLSFVVDRTGYLRNICVERGLTRAADAEAVRVLSRSPRWAPGIFNGRDVSIRYTVPVHFRSPD